MRLGFIGLGVMGSRMVPHLVKAGYPVSLFDRDEQATRRAAKDLPGTEVASSPREVGQRSDVVVTMLPAGQAVQDALFGPEGVAEGLAAGGLVIDVSSSEPWCTLETGQRLRSKGLDMLDAPVSGGSEGAAQGTLTFMVGGEEEVFLRGRPVLEAMGKKVFHVGPLGAGHAMKAVNNVCGAFHMVGTVEALLIGKAYGIDPAVMAEVLNVSTGRSYFTERPLKDYVLTRTFAAGFKMDLMIKDIGIARGLAERLGVPVPLIALTEQLWRAARAELGPDQTVDDIARWLEQLAGVELKPGRSR